MLARVYSNRAEAQAEREKYKKAIADYENSVQISNDPICYYNKGLLQIKLCNHSAAIQEYTNAIENGANMSNIYLKRGLAYATLEKIVLAVSDYTKAIELDPENIEAYINRGNANKTLGNYRMAVNDYTKVIELDPQKIGAYLDRGGINILQGNFDIAIDDYAKAKKLNPEDANVYSNLGWAHFEMNNYHVALENYEKAISLSPKPFYYVKLGQIKYRLCKYKEAIADYSRGIDLDSNNASCYQFRGLAYQKIGRYHDAIDDLTKALVFDPQSKSLYGERGLIYHLLGMFIKAKSDYYKALELEPTDNDYHQLMQERFDWCRLLIDEEIKVTSPVDAHDYAILVYKEISFGAKDVSNIYKLARNGLRHTLKHRRTEKALMADPKLCWLSWLHAMLLQAQGLLDHREGQLDSALKRYNKATKYTPLKTENLMLHLYRAEMLFHWQDYRALSEVVKIITELYPRHPQALKLKQICQSHSKAAGELDEKTISDNAKPLQPTSELPSDSKEGAKPLSFSS